MARRRGRECNRAAEACVRTRHCCPATRQRALRMKPLRMLSTRRRARHTLLRRGRPARHVRKKPSRAPSLKPSRRRRARRRDPHLRGGPGRRPQPPAHDGLLRGRQGQEGRDLCGVRGGRRRYRSLCLSNSVAQWIAYQTSNLGVAGSSPVGVESPPSSWRNG